MPSPALCTEEEVQQLVHASCASVRSAESLWYGYLLRQADRLPQGL